MVKLTEIIRKSADKKPISKPGIVSKAFQVKADKEDSLPEIKKIYEDIIFRVSQIMSDIKEGKTIQGKKIVNIAEEILSRLRVNNTMLLSLINIFSFYGEKEDYLYAHSVNASILATNIGLALGYSEDELIDLCASTLLHDVGILRIPKKIINKPGSLTGEEYERVKKHPALGLELLDSIKNAPESASEVVYQHHERIDGSGYPEGRRGEEISEFAKIAAIVEVYEAITHPRPYRVKKIIPYNGVKMIVQEARSSFEPRLVKVFLNYITPYPLGSFVLLNTDEIGKVVEINENLPLRPVVEVYYDGKGKPPEKSRRIDLAKSPVIFIKQAVDESEL